MADTLKTAPSCDCDWPATEDGQHAELCVLRLWRERDRAWAEVKRLRELLAHG